MVLAGYGASVTALEGTSLRTDNPTGNLQVIDAALESIRAPAGLESYYTDDTPPSGVNGPCLSAKEAAARVADGQWLVSGKDFSAGGWSGGPVLFLGDDGKPYILGFITAAQPVAKLPGATPVSASAGLVDTDMPQAATLTRTHITMANGRRIRAFVNKAAQPGYVAAEQKPLVPNHWKPTDFFDPETVLFGPEFEFTLPKGSMTVAEGDAAALAIVAKIRALCASEPVDCSYDEVRGINVVAKDGTKIRVITMKDPNVVEITLDPLTIEQTKKAADLIQKFVFDAVTGIG